MNIFKGLIKHYLGMTALTYNAEKAAMDLEDPDEIARFIHEDFPIRTVKEELEKVIDAAAEKMKLSRDEVIKILRKKCGGVNVKNWLSGKNPLKKDSALKIAFALNMNYKEASWFLMQGCWLDGFYLRDYKDIIYRFCLENKMDYEQAQAMIQEHSHLEDIPNPNVKLFFGFGGAVTNAIDIKTRKMKNKAELDSFINLNREYFGTFRRKSYEKFMEFYNLIKNRKDFSEDVPIDEEICKLFAMGIPSLKGKKTIINYVLKKVADDTLSRTTLSEIVGKQPIKRGGDDVGKITEVKRKHLILLWLYVNAGSPDFCDGDYSDREAAFNDCRDDINDNLLEPCGMPLLDPRNPFDWIVLNAIHYAYFNDEDEEENDKNETDENDSNAVARIKKITELLFDRGDGNEDNLD